MADSDETEDDDERVPQLVGNAKWCPAKGKALSALHRAKIFDIHRIEGGEDDGMIRIEENCDNYYSVTAPPEFLRYLANELLKVADECRKTN